MYGKILKLENIVSFLRAYDFVFYICLFKDLSRGMGVYIIFSRGGRVAEFVFKMLRLIGIWVHISNKHFSNIRTI